jgi:hypothetical protein
MPANHAQMQSLMQKDAIQNGDFLLWQENHTHIHEHNIHVEYSCSLCCIVLELTEKSDNHNGQDTKGKSGETIFLNIELRAEHQLWHY